MRLNNTFLDVITVIIIIFAILLGANGLAVSQSTPSITRVLNGSAAGAVKYQPGEQFTVELGYNVSGKPYAISVKERLPVGWEITNSSLPYSINATTNAYTWNITSPLSGVSDGKIFYQVKIPDGAGQGDYEINGTSKWSYTYSDLSDGEYTYSYISPDSTVGVNATETHGPCIWITNPYESTGDGDGHLEAGEEAAFSFSIETLDGISQYDVYYNGVLLTEGTDYTLSVADGSNVAGAGSVLITGQADPNDLENGLRVDATDNSSDLLQSSLELPFYAPKYDYTAWATAEWNNWEVTAACLEPAGSLDDGGWLLLEGGNTIKVPAIETHYIGGPDTINLDELSMSMIQPGLGLLGIGDSLNETRSMVNFTPQRDVVFPTNTYSVYSVYNGTNTPSATFHGSPEMGGGQVFHVALVNLSGLDVKPDDFKDAICSSDLATDANGDIRITSAELPGLAGLPAGYYALVVLDYRLPNAPCLVAMTPIFVTENCMTVDVSDPELPMPGDTLTLNLSLQGTPAGSEYQYFAVMLPERNYSAAFNITSDGTLEGTSYSFNGLTFNETLAPDPANNTFTVTGMTGVYTLDPDDLQNSLLILAMSEFGAANVTFGMTGATSSTSDVALAIQTWPTMPTCKYVVLTVAVDMDTGAIAAINQTTLKLVATHNISLYTGWNLVSLPFTPLNDSLNATFTPDVMSHVFVVWEYNSSNASSPWDYYVTAGYPYVQGNLSRFNESFGYWVLCYNNTTLQVAGTTPESDTVEVNDGWNLVGNPYLYDRNVTSIYPDSFVVWEYDGIKQQYDYWCSAADTPGSIYVQGTLQTLKPGYGYWVLELAG